MNDSLPSYRIICNLNIFNEIDQIFKHFKLQTLIQSAAKQTVKY